mgnify:CR=1 FL=1
MQSERLLRNGGAFLVIYVLKSYKFIQRLSENWTGLKAYNTENKGLPPLPIYGMGFAY